MLVAASTFLLTALLVSVGWGVAVSASEPERRERDLSSHLGSPGGQPLPDPRDLVTRIAATGPVDLPAAREATGGREGGRWSWLRSGRRRGGGLRVSDGRRRRLRTRREGGGSGSA